MPVSPSHDDIVTVATIIQLAVAPVFLLTGIAGLLNVMATRLGRITDRARSLERRLAETRKADLIDTLNHELTNLWQRAHLINWALSLGTVGALLVCVVIVALFIGDFSSVDLSGMIAPLFVASMLALIVALLFFIREVRMATATVKQGVDSLVDDHGE